MPSEIFGINVFDDRVMRQRLPKEKYKELKQVIDYRLDLNRDLAEVVANAMKDWAISKGATHYTHWFQPLNGFTAEKHESFIRPMHDGGAIMEFSGKMLIKGESDASSFPSGGLRQTFEARGYTMWDPTSPAFLKEDKSGVTLCIPTAFCSWGGTALDEKTPLLRSVKAISNQSLRVLRQFGEYTVKNVKTNVGAEQEYFLIDADIYKHRMDLVLSGRTLFGAKPPKGQEMDDYYFGLISEKISPFMSELDEELWKMGVSAKTKHNEVAPCQHELAPIFSVENIAADQNQLIMETLDKLAARHGLKCLLHEKPFAYINGSGKHNNWNLATDTGLNLMNPGDNPYDNAKFLVFLCAVIKAIDVHAGLLRVSAASAGNDHRLGACEAPPAIISICLGEELTNVLKKISGDIGEDDVVVDDMKRLVDFGVPSLPMLYADASDRNRTSPFAFTGNKFEFRMIGSSMTISWANTILNTIVASVLDEFATRLENTTDFDNEITSIIADTYNNHGRVIFNGNGYSDEWVEEAVRRGLPNYKDTVECVKELISDKTIELFEKYEIYTAEEMHARYEITLEAYNKRRMIEAKTMVIMAEEQIYPAVNRYVMELADSVKVLEKVFDCTCAQKKKLKEYCSNIDRFQRSTDALKESIARIEEIHDEYEKAFKIKEEMLVIMDQLREASDELEQSTDLNQWPFPTYCEILYDIQA
ncbi:glutamine synthetase III [Candidatus Soleaferrea massiliensis]|uniref:glutamine synthetase III family protein n=1 Tax=Candidatus Soleaferrea massiliensis TaxID=1470354 RepID=UPI0005916028|nr:glutamine synthetase III [Candidatus Soleaferrea massiliensis]